jgi:hypothetical protein
MKHLESSNRFSPLQEPGTRHRGPRAESRHLTSYIDLSAEVELDSVDGRAVGPDTESKVDDEMTPKQCTPGSCF